MNSPVRSFLRISTMPPRSPEADRVLVEALLPDNSRKQAVVEYLFRVSRPEVDDLEWYFEKFLEFDDEPAPTIARGIEKHLYDRGGELFRSVLDANDDIRALWQAFQPHIADADFELVSGPGAGAAIHWEFLREPEAEMPLSMRMRSFVHVPVGSQPAPANLACAHAGQLRVLLAIERPAGIGDVPYRSVAAGLVRAACNATIKIDVLRPPDIEQLAIVLEDAAKSGKPYDILHFDGHGGYGATGGRIVFEDPESFQKSTTVDGLALGTLMTKTGTKTLVLNACRSAFADPRLAKDKSGSATDFGASLIVGSFAEQAVRAGVQHVVAMRYNLYVTTATQFFAAFYDALSQGHLLGGAVALARRALASTDATLQYWAVPALYRSDAVVELSKDSENSPRTFPLQSKASDLFVGRNEIIYRLDRTLDSASIILLYGPAGVGKTAVAHEFAEWYRNTDGIPGPAASTSLDEDSDLSLLQTALPEFVLRIAAQRGLWIIDDLDKLTPAHRQRLCDMVLEAAQRGAKVILISRDGSAWTHPDVVPVVLLPMPLDECEQLIRSYGHSPAGVGIRSLLQFSQGNPQVLRLVRDLAPVNGATESTSLDDLVTQLAAGDIDLSPERFSPLRLVVEDLRRRLPDFNAKERAMIAPLCLFRENAVIAAWGTMGEPSEWQLPALAGATSPALVNLLRAIERSGMAQTLDFSFGLHPLVPVILRPVFDQQYPTASPARKQVQQAFCGALAKGCNSMINTYNQSGSSVLGLLAVLDASLASAWEMICREAWWSYAPAVLSARCLYVHETSQDTQLQRLLDQTAPFLIDEATHSPIPGREATYEIWTSFRVRLLRKQGNWKDAEELVLRLVSNDRGRVAGLLRSDETKPWSPQEQRSVGTLASDLYQLGIIKLARKDEASSEVLKEAADLARRANNPGLASKIETLTGRSSLLVELSPTSVPPELQVAMNGPNPVAAAAAWMNLGQLRLDLLNRFLEDNPDDSDALFAGALEINQAAKDAFLKALELAPPNLQDMVAEATLSIGECEMQSANYAAAETSFAKALNLYDGANRPAEAAAARAFLAMAMRRDNRVEGALIYANAALQYYRQFDSTRAAALLADFPELQTSAAAVE